MNKEIIFEVMPYSKASSKSYAKKITDRIEEVIKELKNITLLNIPEIVEENHFGQPYYRNIDVRKFGKVLREKCDKEIIVNTVVVHHNSKKDFGLWLDEAIEDYGINNFVFVGAKIPSLKYPGPSVTEANLIANSKNANFGNIFIPDRPNEVSRLIEKTKAGCRFFTSQVLFEANTTLKTINEYIRRCKANSLQQSKFYLSLAPVSSEEDVTFIKWLGAEMSKETESRLKKSENIGEESIKVALEAIKKILSVNNKTIKAEIGLNIEYIMLHNLDLAKDMVKRAYDLLCKFDKI